MRRIIIVGAVMIGLLVWDLQPTEAKIGKGTKILAGAIVGVSFLGAIARMHREDEMTKVMKSWMGHHKADMILQWGPPTRTTSDGRDGEILIYEYDKTGAKIVSNNISPLAEQMFGPSYSVQQTGYVARRMFWANKDGILYHWQWRGL